MDLKLPFHSEEAKETFSAHCIHCWSAGLSSKEINCRRDASNLVLLDMIIWYDVNEQESKILIDSELVVVTWRGGGKEPGAPCDGVALYLVTAGKLLPRGRRHHRHRHAVSPSPGVCPGPGHQQQRVRLSLLLNTDDQTRILSSQMVRHDQKLSSDLLVVELWEGVAREAAPPGLAVLNQGQMLLLLGAGGWIISYVTRNIRISGYLPFGCSITFS